MRVGTDGDDVLKGCDMDETFSGGKGSDTLYGGGGEDTYLWNAGDGDDVIVNASAGKGTLRFGPGVAADGVSVEASGGDLVFVVEATGEKITVKGWRSYEKRMLARVEFADGTVWQGSQRL